jgi:hypothetical protein
MLQGMHSGANFWHGITVGQWNACSISGSYVKREWKRLTVNTYLFSQIAAAPAVSLEQWTTSSYSSIVLYFYALHTFLTCIAALCDVTEVAHFLPYALWLHWEQCSWWVHTLVHSKSIKCTFWAQAFLTPLRIIIQTNISNKYQRQGRKSAVLLFPAS